jgi:23S rRNA (uracil1939-C5)-methyltransferase
MKFKIDHIDPMGQGVSKEADKITFIPKTLPGEQGNAQIIRKQKKIQFAKINSSEDLDQVSDIRTQAACPHYDQCSGCHYLHTSYENELKFKHDGIQWLLRSLEKNYQTKIDAIIHKASERDGYRNRVQLHYLKNHQILGFHTTENKVAKVPQCLLPLKSIKSKLAELYKDNYWLELVKSEPNRGHIEIYHPDGEELKININKSYAQGGFTQVNKEMNEKMVKLIESKLKDSYHSDGKKMVLDLFGGSGNLTKTLNTAPTLVVDATPEKFIQLESHQEYAEINLYDKNALKELEALISLPVECLVIDPPRSGHKDLPEFIEATNPEHILYISCQASTMIRDISNLHEKYELEEVHLFDLFPSTHHFETIAFLRKK